MSDRRGAGVHVPKIVVRDRQVLPVIDSNAIVLALYQLWFGEDQDAAHMGIRAATKDVAFAGNLPAAAADCLSLGHDSPTDSYCVARVLGQRPRLACEARLR